MKNILVPTDLSESSKNTLKYAITLSEKGNTKLFFYHASPSIKPSIQEDAIAFIKGVFNELGFNYETVKPECIVENVRFSNADIKTAIEKYDIDLVIMGTSHEGLIVTFFGSHVSELINDVSCPVLSIPHGFSDMSIERIGYATELHDLSARVKEIVPFAKIFGASIEAFHVYPVFPHVVDIETYDIKKSLSQLHNDNSYDKINLHFVKTPFDNEPVTGIREFIKLYKPDMLVMCHKPKGLFDKLLLNSGVTPEIVKVSPIPILALNQKTACKIM